MSAEKAGAGPLTKAIVAFGAVAVTALVGIAVFIVVRQNIEAKHVRDRIAAAEQLAEKSRREMALGSFEDALASLDNALTVVRKESSFQEEDFFNQLTGERDRIRPKADAQRAQRIEAQERAKREAQARERAKQIAAERQRAREAESAAATVKPVERNKPTVTEPQQQETTVYVTKSGRKYHRAHCSYLRRGAIAMKLSEAKGRYGPCSRCKPP